jgi:hypothetical protein
MSPSRREKQDGDAAPRGKKPAGQMMSRNVAAAPKGAAGTGQKGPKAARGPSPTRPRKRSREPNSDRPARPRDHVTAEGARPPTTPAGPTSSSHAKRLAPGHPHPPHSAAERDHRRRWGTPSPGAGDVGAAALGTGRRLNRHPLAIVAGCRASKGRLLPFLRPGPGAGPSTRSPARPARRPPANRTVSAPLAGPPTPTGAESWRPGRQRPARCLPRRPPGR